MEKWSRKKNPIQKGKVHCCSHKKNVGQNILNSVIRNSYYPSLHTALSEPSFKKGRSLLKARYHQ